MSNVRIVFDICETKLFILLNMLNSKPVCNKVNISREIVSGHILVL